MDQLHKRFRVEQVQVLLQGYSQGSMTRNEVEEMLQINKTRFFELLKDYRRDPEVFSIAYERATPAHLSAEVEAAIQEELLREKAIDSHAGNKYQGLMSLSHSSSRIACIIEPARSIQGCIK